MIKVPSKATLRKYGLTEELFLEFAAAQEFACGVCGLRPINNKLCIDHEHVKGWKKLPPEERVLYVRGLCDWVCNSRILTKGVTRMKLIGAVLYLGRYEERRKLNG